MSTDVTHAPWHDLATKGYVHVKGFLGPNELKFLRDDYAKHRDEDSGNANYAVVNVSWMSIWRLESKMSSVAKAVREAAGVNTDLSVGALYFAIEKGIDFAWHQDHESFFIFQQHHDYLNFYIPILKSDPKHSNLSIVPFDRLLQRAPAQYNQLAFRGAQRFKTGKPTLVSNDEDGGDYTLPVDLEELKETPELEAGDLLLLRGDIIHRTQDTDSDRISISLRRTNSMAPIDRQRLLSGCTKKQEMISNNRAAYDHLFECFAHLKCDRVTARQLHNFALEKATRPVPAPAPAVVSDKALA